MTFRTTFILGFLFLFLNIAAFAQKENNNWYFGRYAGITFNNGKPVALAPSALISWEGSISVSDSAGNLLFYSNGLTIWNRNHVPMQNGTGLMGDISATQSVLAVPKPSSEGVYYIFTVDSETNNLKNGLRYSVLDMKLDGGLGGITNVKNVLLEVPVTEKLTAARHGNNKDYWILSHKLNSNEFLVFELTSAGISTAPVISKTGSVHNAVPYNAIGQMKANRESTKIALVIEGLKKLELFDFNSFTGIISNIQTTNLLFDSPYGVEFSGDGTKLYVSVTKLNESQNYILQYNLAHPTGINTFFPIPLGSIIPRALQIGPDNKIYCSLFNNYLGVIHNPDSLGFACKFNSKGVNLNGETSFLGLPNMFIPARKKASELRVDTSLCLGDSINLGQEAVSGNSYLWQDSSTKSTYVVTKPGKYKLKVRNWYFEEAFEFNVQLKDCSPVIPNIITPNQDNLNDAFVLKNLNSTDFELQLFNRWGNLIYKTESYQNDWDAKGNSAGMYYYLLRNSETGTTYKGWLEVVK